ncbi:hypothetical protein NQZ68_016565 [Dissostichus eleginoides]|nr:hypothetical protein NQZ68_016565 [Dissostichus eleginoides]
MGKHDKACARIRPIYSVPVLSIPCEVHIHRSSSVSSSLERVPYYQAWIGRIMWNNPIVKSLPRSFLQLVAQWKWGAKMVRLIRWLSVGSFQQLLTEKEPNMVCQLCCHAQISAWPWSSNVTCVDASALCPVGKYTARPDCTLIAPCPLISDSHSQRHFGSRLRGVLFVIGSDDLHVPPWHRVMDFMFAGGVQVKNLGKQLKVTFTAKASLPVVRANMQTPMRDLAAHTGDSTSVCQLPSACRGIGVYSSSLLILGLTRFPVAPGPANQARHGTRQKRSPTRLRLGHQLRAAMEHRYVPWAEESEWYLRN